MATDTFKDWKPGDPPLKGSDVAGNFRAIRAQIAGMFALGVRDAFVAIVQSGRQLTFKTAAGSELGGVTLPLAPNDPKGTRIVGKRYFEDDSFCYQGSSYVVLQEHVAREVFADDAAFVTLLAAKGEDGANGRDAETFRGTHDPTKAYSKGDAVYTGTVSDPDGLRYWRTIEDVPANAGAQKAPPNYPWLMALQTPVEEITAYIPGPIPASNRVWRWLPTLAGGFALDLAGCRATLAVAPSALVRLSLRKNGTAFGSLTFAAGNVVGVFGLAAGAQGPLITKADEISVVALSRDDGTAQDLALSLRWYPS